jgi:hypothetical protein
LRGVTDEEYALVQAARNDPATRQMIVLTVGAQDAAAAPAEEPKAEAPKPKIIYSDEPDDEDEVEAIEEPKKRPAKKAADVVVEQNDLSSVLNAWGDEDD